MHTVLLKRNENTFNLKKSVIDLYAGSSMFLLLYNTYLYFYLKHFYEIIALKVMFIFLKVKKISVWKSKLQTTAPHYSYDYCFSCRTMQC